MKSEDELELLSVEWNYNCILPNTTKLNQYQAPLSDEGTNLNMLLYTIQGCVKPIIKELKHQPKPFLSLNYKLKYNYKIFKRA